MYSTKFCSCLNKIKMFLFCLFYHLPNCKCVLLVNRNSKELFREILLLDLTWTWAIHNKRANNSSELEKYGPKLIGHLRNAHPVEFLLAERLTTFLSSDIIKDVGYRLDYQSESFHFIIHYYTDHSSFTWACSDEI